jgi:hypothetical protein
MNAEFKGEQDQPPLVKARMNWNERVLVLKSEAVHRPAVGCIVGLDAGISPALENIVCLCMSKPKLVGKYLNDLPNLRPAVGEAHINVLTAGITHHLEVTLLSAAIIANPSSTMPSRSLLGV